LRVPPTEKRGRTQTSVVTIAITIPSEFEFTLDRSKVKRSYIRSSKKGGQNVNKVSSCVQLTDSVTGLQVKVMDTRDQNKNEEIAWDRLEEKISLIYKEEYDKSIYNNRFEQVGNSNRSIKKRSYRIKEDNVTDHETGKFCSFKDFQKGKIELLS
jgi:protein subunit release factor A